MLSGYKTYIFGVLGLATVAGYWFGVVDLQTANMLLGVFGFGGLISLRQAVANS